MFSRNGPALEIPERIDIDSKFVYFLFYSL